MQTAQFELTSTALAPLGLQESDIDEIHALANSLQADQPLSIARFGQTVSESPIPLDELLSQVKNSDLDEAGKKLSTVVTLARKINIGPLSGSRSKIPLIGRLLDRVKLKVNAVKDQFESTRTQIDALMTEVSTVTQNISGRNHSLEQFYQAGQMEHRQLGLHIAAGKLRLAQMQAELSEQTSADVVRMQPVSDLRASAANLEKRIGDLAALQQATLQSLPMIRMIQANNQMLVDKFHTIQAVTLPAWERQFVLQLSLNDQRNAVDLAASIDDATNDLLRQNADLLYHNSVETAKANQRLVIDVGTLQYVQDTLIKSVDDVVRIHRDGQAQREQAQMQFERMRQDLATRLTHQRGGSQA